MKYVLIESKRSHPELNTVRKDVSELHKYYLKDKQEAISKYFMCFTNRPRIGINPKATYSTPMGVYGYPLKVMYPEFLKNRDNWYAMNRDHINILKVNTDSVLDITHYTNYKSDMELLEDFWENEIQSDIPFRNLIQKVTKGRTSGSKVFQAKTVYKLALLMAKILKPHVDPKSLWTKILNKVLQYDAVNDDGTSTIHPYEPHQIVFLTPTAYKVVDRLDNNRNRYTGDETGISRVKITDNSDLGNMTLDAKDKQSLHSLPNVNNLNFSRLNILNFTQDLTISPNINAEDVYIYDSYVRMQGKVNCETIVFERTNGSCSDIVASDFVKIQQSWITPKSVVCPKLVLSNLNEKSFSDLLSGRIQCNEATLDICSLGDVPLTLNVHRLYMLYSSGDLRWVQCDILYMEQGWMINLDGLHVDKLYCKDIKDDYFKGIVCNEIHITEWPSDNLDLRKTKTKVVYTSGFENEEHEKEVRERYSKYFNIVIQPFVKP